MREVCGVVVGSRGEVVTLRFNNLSFVVSRVAILEWMTRCCIKLIRSTGEPLPVSSQPRMRSLDAVTKGQYNRSIRLDIDSMLFSTDITDERLKAALKIAADMCRFRGVGVRGHEVVSMIIEAHRLSTLIDPKSILSLISTCVFFNARLESATERIEHALDWKDCPPVALGFVMDMPDAAQMLYPGNDASES